MKQSTLLLHADFFLETHISDNTKAIVKADRRTDKLTAQFGENLSFVCFLLVAEMARRLGYPAQPTNNKEMGAGFTDYKGTSTI